MALKVIYINIIMLNKKIVNYIWGLVEQLHLMHSTLCKFKHDKLDNDNLG